METNTPNPQQIQVLNFSTIVLRMGIDLNFLAITTIIFGVVYCLTIIGAIFGIPLLIAGLRMKESAKHFKNYANDNNMAELEVAIERQYSFIYIFKILAAISLILIILSIVVYIIFISLFITAFSGLFQSL